MKEIDVSDWEWDVNINWTLRDACEAGAKTMFEQMQRDLFVSLKLTKNGQAWFVAKDLDTETTFFWVNISEAVDEEVDLIRADKDWKRAKKLKAILASCVAKLESLEHDRT